MWPSAQGTLFPTPVHRPSADACPNELDPDAAAPELPEVRGLDGGVIERAAFIMDECARDADCTQHPYGHCVVAYVAFSPAPSQPYYACTYGCVVDTDCNQDELCMCSGPIGQCVPARCHTDADCEGGACWRFEHNNMCGGTFIDFKCAQPGIECTTDADCDSRFRCVNATCTTRTAC